MLSTAHIFYIAVLLLVGAFVGYYVGRYHRDLDEEAKRKKQERRRSKS